MDKNNRNYKICIIDIIILLWLSEDTGISIDTNNFKNDENGKICNTIKTMSLESI